MITLTCQFSQFYIYILKDPLHIQQLKINAWTSNFLEKVLRYTNNNNYTALSSRKDS